MDNKYDLSKGIFSMRKQSEKEREMTTQKNIQNVFDLRR